MAVAKRKGLPSGRGERDSQHHKDRVRKQIQKHLKSHIGGEDIVAGGGDGKIKVPVRGSKRWQFIFDRGKSGGGQGDGEGDGPSGRNAGTEPGAEDYEVWLDMKEVEDMLFAELGLPRLKPKKEIDAEVADIKFDTIAVKGPQIDKKATLRRNLLRTSATGDDDFDKDDLRYMSYREKPRPKSKAVVFMAMDVSASMGPHEKQVARLFFYWVVRFLRYKYDTVEVKFISHTTEAKEVNEHEFFNRAESGGTAVSSAYKLIERMQSECYPEEDWNIYVLHASDGDNWEVDNQDVYDSLVRLCKIASLVGYLEIAHEEGSWLAWGQSVGSSSLTSTLDSKGSPGSEFISAHVKGEQEIWGAIKRFFQADEVDNAVNV